MSLLRSMSRALYLIDWLLTFLLHTHCCVAGIFNLLLLLSLVIDHHKPWAWLLLHVLKLIPFRSPCFFTLCQFQLIVYQRSSQRAHRLNYIHFLTRRGLSPNRVFKLTTLYLLSWKTLLRHLALRWRHVHSLSFRKLFWRLYFIRHVRLKFSHRYIFKVLSFVSIWVLVLRKYPCKYFFESI